MAKTKDGKRDLEAEVIARCVKAIKLEGRGDVSSRFTTYLGTADIKRVLIYLAARFGVTL